MTTEYKAAKIIEALAETRNADSEFYAGDDVDGDVTSYFEGVLAAVTYVFEKITGADVNNVEMTHELNKLAVQMAVKHNRFDNEVEDANNE